MPPAAAVVGAFGEVEACRGRPAPLDARVLPCTWQRAVYSLADAVVHISAADSSLERALFNQSCGTWRTLHMSPRGFNSLGDGAAAAAATAPATARVSASGGLILGFMGNGVTPTNH